jgi:hypothetical protein
VIHVLFLHAAEYAYQTSALIESINRSVDMRAALCTQWEVDHLENYIGSDVDIVVTVHSRGMIVETITAFCRKNEVVTVTLQDGIMDYMHWTVVAPDRYNPLLTDYIFVFGEASRRLLIDREVDESKIIVTGCPRFDQYVTTERNDRYVLITCANTPYHILREKVSLLFIFFRLICHCKMSGTPFRLRLPGKLKKSLMFRFLSLLLPRSARLERSLAEDMADAMCVCTTMSTLVLESLCLRKPVVLIKNHGYRNYINVPHQMTGLMGKIQPKPISSIRFNEAYEKILLENVAFLGNSTNRVVEMLRELGKSRVSESLNQL